MNKRDAFIIGGFILLALVFRFIHFSQRLHFASDQATSSLRALEIWQNKEVTLVGMTTSMEYEGRHAYFGSTAYYLQLIPLLLGNFDPVAATFIFTLISILMIIPLYVGSKKLTNQNGAISITAGYVLLPNFIEYTTFLWNPNTQLVLAPVAVWLMGMHKQKPRPIKLLLLGAVLGLMLTLHYQFIIALIGIFIIYCGKLIKSHHFGNILYLLLGLVIGFSPVIFNELHTNFYNTQIFLLFFQHWSEITGKITSLPLYYFNSVIFFGIVGVVVLLYRKIPRYCILVIVVILVAIDGFVYFPKPKSSYNASGEWYYQDEIKANEIIDGLKLTDFNIINLVYNDSLASVQKYLLATKHPDVYTRINSSYDENSKLLIMAANDTDLAQSINYEVNTFIPKTMLSFPLGENYTLYLWQR